MARAERRGSEKPERFRERANKVGGESDLAAPLTFAPTHTDAAQLKRSALGARNLARATPRSYSNLGGAPDTNSERTSEQVILARVTVHPPGSRSREGTRDSSG